MKLRLTTLLLLCVTLAGCDQIPTYVCKTVKESCSTVLPVYKGEPLERDGLLYKPNSNEPLTARIEDYSENGQLEREYTVIDGKKEGLYQAWFENGQLWYEVTYVNGKREGLDQWRYANGEPRPSTCNKAGEKVDMSYCEEKQQ